MSNLPTTVATDLPKGATRPTAKEMHRVEPIVFSCPNGHRIVVDAALAGRTGRCKECKEIVRIPSAQPGTGATAAGPAVGAPPKGAPPVAEDRQVAESRALHREPSDGPSLIINEPPPPPRRGQAATDRTVIGEPLIEGESALGAPSIDPTEVQINFGAEEVAGGPPPQTENSGDEPVLVDEGASAAMTLVNPTARLMERLWYERRHGGVIEVHLTGAVSPILPSYFYPGWSDGSHGLFASLAADGTVTLTAVAWESVQKIVVRHVDSIPPDFLDIGLDE